MIVITRLHGGLGNQLFQYAAGRALAERRGARLLLDASAYDHVSVEHPYRLYRLDRFCISAALATPDDVERITGLERHDPFSLAWRRLEERWFPRHWRRRFAQRHVRFDDHLLRIRHSVVLVGYWQSAGYAALVEPLLRKELRLRTPPVGRNAELAAEIAATQAVSVHVRRGDFLAVDTHDVLPVSYYEAALKHVAANAPQANYYVFSDDVSWCREHLPLPESSTYVDHNSAGEAAEDLRLMSLCQYHIISNSSFSWWGAWLSSRQGNLVIAPQRCLTKYELDVKSRYPADWRLL